MTLPSTGQITFDDIRNELGVTGAITLNDPLVRSLAGIASGAITLADFRGKSALPTVNMVTAQNSQTSPTWRGYQNASYPLAYSTTTSRNTFGSVDTQDLGGGFYLQQFTGRSNAVNELTIHVNKPDESSSLGSTPGFTGIKINGVSYSLPSWQEVVRKNSTGQTVYANYVTFTVSGIYSLLVSGANIKVEFE